MPKFNLPLRVFLAFTALLSLVVLAVVMVMGGTAQFDDMTAAVLRVS